MVLFGNILGIWAKFAQIYRVISNFIFINIF